MLENIKLVQTMYAAFERGDIPFIVERLSDGVEWIATQCTELPYHGTYSGPAGALQFFERLDGTMNFTAFEPLSYMASGDEVMTTGRSAGSMKASGKTFEVGWAMLFRIKDGRITYFREWEDSGVLAAALAA